MASPQFLKALKEIAKSSDWNAKRMDIASSIAPMLSGGMNVGDVYAIVKIIEKLLNIQKGDKGDKGDLPTKGSDYFTPEEIQQFLDIVTPVKGVDYMDGVDGKDGKSIKGDPGKDGEDGQDGIANMGEVDDAVVEGIQKHEKTYDHTLIHDPAILGTKKVDEGTLVTGGVLTFNGTKLVYEKPVQQKITERPKYWGGNAPVNPKLYPHTVTTTYTLTNEDGVILASSAGGAFTLTLPDANAFGNYQFFIKKTNTEENLITIAASGSDLIDGASTQGLIVQYASMHLFSSGSAWFIL